MTWDTNSKHRSIRSCRTWTTRSPSVAGAWCTVPVSSRNGCNPAGRGPENRRSHACDPTPATHARGAPGARKPTDRCRPAQSLSRSLVTASPPGLIVSTKKIAAAVSGASTGCGCGSGKGRATAGTPDHSVTTRPSLRNPYACTRKINAADAPQPGRGRLHPAAFLEQDKQAHHGQDLGADP